MEKLIEEEFQKRKEIVNNFEKNYLLEAGAGAGKTTIIVERVINHIVKGGIDPKGIVAITFTKAASLELAERIERKALEYLSSEEDNYNGENLERVEELFSGTIHSFCEMLLREMPFEAGLTPGYEIVEDVEEFHEKIWYEFLRNNNESNKESIDRLRRFNIEYRDLKSGAFAAMDNPDIEFIGFDSASSYSDLEEEFKSIKIESLNSTFLKKNSNLGKFFIAMVDGDIDFKESIGILLKECPKVSKEDDLASKYISKANLEKDGAEELLVFIESIFEIYEKLNATIYNQCTDFVNSIKRYKEKHYRNYLTFNDLLYRACSLIKNSSKARKHFKSKFKYFYIDEAQDTDPLQAELLLLLSHDGDSDGLQTFLDVKPKPGSLFIVADPKQSIYRFRRADINIYEAVKTVIRKHGEVVNLDINFRSTGGICRWVEESFKDRSDGFAFGEHSTPTQAGFKRILSFWDEEEHTDKEIDSQMKLSGVYDYRFPDEEIKEEEYISNLIKESIDKKYIDEKIGKDKFITRKVENKDIMILTKTNEETGIYLDALKRNNIPALLAGEKKLSDNREVLNLFFLIDFLVDSRDDIKLVSVLRNNFYLELETINILFQRGKLKYKISDEEKLKNIDHPHLREAFLKLKEMFTKSKYIEPIIFVEELIKNKIGIYNLYHDYSEIEKRDADSSLLQTMELLKSKKPISLYSIKEELQILIDKTINYELPIDLDFSENAVRVMNIHKSKGLEAAIVILVGRNKKRSLIPDQYYIEKQRDKNLGYIRYKNSIGVICHQEDMRKEREQSFKEAELDRLIYVAATRAKSVLVIPSIEDDKMFLYPLNKNIKQSVLVENTKIENVAKELTQRKKDEIDITKEMNIKEEIRKASFEKLNPSTSGEKLSYKKSYLVLEDKLGPRGKTYGVIVHRMFEIVLKDKIDLNKISKDDIDYSINIAINESLNTIDLDGDVIRQLLPENRFDLEIDDKSIIKKELKEYLYKNLKIVIDYFLNNESIIEIYSNAKKVFTEFSFSASIPPSLLKEEDSKNIPLIVNGVIDLLIQVKDGNFIIVDYKTDIYENSFIEDLKDRYRNQLEIYKIVLEEVLKEEALKVESLMIYSTCLNKMIVL